MRAATLILMLWLASSAIAGPHVTAHISQQDVRQISAIIRAVTPEPILSIDPVYERQRIPGSIPRETVELGLPKGGQIQTKPIVMYERTDRVGIQTGSQRNLTGGSYIVQRVGNTWKILSKSS